MFQAQDRETINTWKVAVSFKIILTTSVSRSYFTTQRQICKTKTKTDVLVCLRHNAQWLLQFSTGLNLRIRPVRRLSSSTRNSLMHDDDDDEDDNDDGSDDDDDTQS